ncbi:hydantoinase B/oxoprolinase family protein [Conexibacter sp. DBS9H8]|uniref:hydantoinase B/oxoprolinase family protein n=1 Tax=Conexibacter sp. DBS9H8 TaxID=2937801 RepID=UPI00200F2376|nr:hydantoinase B/oxoprolinase family protein [Conexibacter sp. DBS9H8]
MIDTTTLTVITNGLQQVCNEMDITIERTSLCPIVSESRDRSSGIYDVDGELISQGETGLPLFVGSMQFAVEAALADIDEWHEGDVVMINDPYTSGTHLMDMKLVKPIFVDGRLFCFLADTAHWTDIGGMVPGGFAPTATEVFQEGIRVPPIKLYERGVLQPGVRRLLMANIRIPHEREADLRAQLSAMAVGETRLRAILARYGAGTVREAINQLADRSEAQMRAMIATVPDGTYSHVEHLDSDGVNQEPLTCAITITVAGELMTFDFAGSSPPVRGPLNTSYAAAASAVYLYMKHIFPEVPNNGGCFRPLEVKRALGTFLDAAYPRAVSGCASEVTVRIGDAVFGALQPILPGRIGAGAYGTICNFTISGYDERRDRPFIMFCFTGGGYGGHEHGDGLTNAPPPISIARSSPVEVLESQNPVLFERYALREDSAGLGRHRGGFGVDLSVRMLADEATSTVLADRGRFAPRGVMGGHDAAMTEIEWELEGQAFIPPHTTKCTGVVMKRGDRLEVRSPGGGGYGDPCDRDPEAVDRDRVEGYFPGRSPGGPDLAKLSEVTR